MQDKGRTENFILGNCRLPVEGALLLFALFVNENVTQERTTELTSRLPSQDLGSDMIDSFDFVLSVLIAFKCRIKQNFKFRLRAASAWKKMFLFWTLGLPYCRFALSSS